MRPEGTRDPVAGPAAGPEPPFPIRLSGPVIKGFGRGSKEVCWNIHSLYSLGLFAIVLVLLRFMALYPSLQRVQCLNDAARATTLVQLFSIVISFSA